LEAEIISWFLQLKFNLARQYLRIQIARKGKIFCGGRKNSTASHKGNNFYLIIFLEFMIFVLTDLSIEFNHNSLFPGKILQKFGNTCFIINYFGFTVQDNLHGKGLGKENYLIL